MQNLGLVYNDYAGRTAQEDSVTAGHTWAFGLGGTTLAGYTGEFNGLSWDTGATGPLWYLSDGIFFTGGFKNIYDWGWCGRNDG